ncbi:MAG: NADH-quinone oxidoreductase subunit NuoG [Candidatus Puniceispirillaceae bacterium]
MPKLTVNGIEVEVDNGASVLQACEEAGFEIPRFCYHERLSIAGNCRMCLVDMERAPKPVASCAMPAADGMVIDTQSERVKKAREGVMEFLLVNHPLDCPICDQGGECDLQDQAMGYGEDRSRYVENKRAVDEKHMGPLIKTVMTRCIHCTRCVRFATEVAGVPELGAIGRGETMEITTYLEKTLASELSANVIDLCPVGALTSRPYAFVARPWELTKVESIDVFDAQGANIRVDARAGQVMRVMPRLNEQVNEEWISDKTRYAIDGLRRQRLDRPYLRGKDGRLHPASWEEALQEVGAQLKKAKSSRTAAIIGDQVDGEAIFALKTLMDKMGAPHMDCRQDGAKLNAKVRASYLFNSTIEGVDEADAILIIGSNPRIEAPVMNARIRRNHLMNKVAIAHIGPQADLTYPADYLGDDIAILDQIAQGDHPFAKTLSKAKKPMIILGMGALRRKDGAAVLGRAKMIADNTKMVTSDWNGFNVLHTAASRVAALDIGFVPGKAGLDTDGILKGAQTGDIKLVWLLGADEIDTSALENAFVIYQGHHGDKGAAAADIILPGAAYTEKNGTYVNFEGRVQRGARAAFPPGEAKDDWAIIRAVSQVINKTLPFDTAQSCYEAMIEAVPHLGDIDEIAPVKWVKFGSTSKLASEPVTAGLDQFYMTCPISRASETMAECLKASQSEPTKVAAE